MLTLSKSITRHDCVAWSLPTSRSLSDKQWYSFNDQSVSRVSVF